MASSTSTQPAKEGTSLDFAGRGVYIRTTNEDVQAPGHQARVENWIHDFEKNRQIFVFPGKYIRAFAGSILGLGLAALILQIASSSLRYAFVPSLLGSGIWIGTFCVATGAVGLAAAHRTSTTLLMDFTVMSLLSSMLSAIVIVLNSIGMEMYTKLCYTSILPLRENLKETAGAGTNTTRPVEDQTPGDTSSVHWIGDCGQSAMSLMGVVVVVHICLFVISALTSAYCCRALNSAFNVRVSPHDQKAPPLVVYHSDTVEVQSKAANPSGRSREVSGDVTGSAKNVEKMIEKLQGQHGHPEKPQESGSFATTASVA